MTSEAFNRDVISYVSELWPDFHPNAAQIDAWFTSFRVFEVEESRVGIFKSYKKSKRTKPLLSEILDGLREVRKTHMGEAEEQLKRDALTLAVVDKENADVDYALSLWTPVDREAAKREILAHEPELLSAFGTLSAMGRWWAHFIFTRKVENRVTIYPGGRPQQMHVDEYWAMKRDTKRQKALIDLESTVSVAD